MSLVVLGALALLVLPGILPPAFAAGGLTKTTSMLTAGYALADPNAGSITQVQGSFVAPKVTCSSGETDAVVYAISIVADGAALGFGCAAGTAAFIPAYTIAGVRTILPTSDTVSSGDSLHFTVTVSSTHKVTIKMSDSSKGWTFSKSGSDSSNSQRAAAWSLTRPGSTSQVPRFGTFKTSNNMLTVSGTKGSLSSFQSTYPIVESNMVNSHGSTLVSTGALSGSGSSFTLTG